MRRLRLPVVGTGADDDPLRVNLPTYTVVEYAPDMRTAVVDVPESEFPDDAAWDALPTLNGLNGPRDVSRLTLAAVDRWHAYLDERYAEHRGRFRPTQDRGR